MNRPVALVGAPSSIGIRPYDDGRARRLDLAPRALRDRGLVERLGARDHGDVRPPPYVDFQRPGRRPRNEPGVAAYSRALAERVASASQGDSFVLLLGGDCSVVLGSLLGLRPRGGPPVGLAYVDGHADFATPEESRTGSAASMCLALAVGRGDTPLARLSAEGPLVRAEDTVLIGRRDHAEPWYGHDALRAAPLLDLPDEAVRERGLDGTARATLERLGSLEGGFWIHVDADVLDPIDLPAVDSPEPGGLRLSELRDLLRPLVHHPRARGMELTIYDPELDPQRVGAVRLTTLLEEVLAAPGA
jgi:arginase